MYSGEYLIMVMNIQYQYKSCCEGDRLKKILIYILILFSILLFNTFLAPKTYAEACTCTAEYCWQPIWHDYEHEWVCYNGNNKIYGWNYINGKWYYFYNSTGYMAHNTFIDGWYVDDNGIWTTEIPYEIERIINIVPDSQFIYTCGNYYNCEIVQYYNQNLKYLCRYGWDVPDVTGTLVCIGYGDEYFVTDDGTVFKTPHQCNDTVYKYDENGNIVSQYYYINPDAVG